MGKASTAALTERVRAVFGVIISLCHTHTHYTHTCHKYTHTQAPPARPSN